MKAQPDKKCSICKRERDNREIWQSIFFNQNETNMDLAYPLVCEDCFIAVMEPIRLIEEYGISDPRVQNWLLAAPPEKAIDGDN